jgi:3-dehydroquinate synthase
MSATDRIRVALGTRSYDVLVGRNLIAAAGPHVTPLAKGRRVFIVTDTHVAKLYLDPLAQALGSAGCASDTLIMPAGEATKSFGELERLCRKLLDMGLERKSLLIALGGGVIGDLVGFAAAILLRGVDFIQIPTTLLAQVDSAVGGKTGINTPEGKNLIGAFYQPRLVLADTASLDSLPRRERLAGYAEVVKYGLIDEPDFFAWLEGKGADVIDGDELARRHAIGVSVRAKARIVGADERESAGRALLNLGHTFAHALEAECGYGDELLHGEAVAIGLCLAFDLSVRLGLCPPEDAARVQRHLASVGLLTAPSQIEDRVWSADRLVAHMLKDKKVADGRVGFVLARGIGRAFHPAFVDLADVSAQLQTAIMP